MNLCGCKPFANQFFDRLSARNCGLSDQQMRRKFAPVLDHASYLVSFFTLSYSIDCRLFVPCEPHIHFASTVPLQIDTDRRLLPRSIGTERQTVFSLSGSSRSLLVGGLETLISPPIFVQSERADHILHSATIILANSQQSGVTPPRLRRTSFAPGDLKIVSRLWPKVIDNIGKFTFASHCRGPRSPTSTPRSRRVGVRTSARARSE